jgi:hypothetical protein
MYLVAPEQGIAFLVFGLVPYFQKLLFGPLVSSWSLAAEIP